MLNLLRLRILSPFGIWGLMNLGMSVLSSVLCGIGIKKGLSGSEKILYALTIFFLLVYKEKKIMN